MEWRKIRKKKNSNDDPGFIIIKPTLSNAQDVKVLNEILVWIEENQTEI